MKSSMAPYLAAVAVLGAAGLALVHRSEPPPEPARAAAADPGVPDVAPPSRLPPNHPPLGPGATPGDPGAGLPPNHPPLRGGAMPGDPSAPMGGGDEAPSIAWKVPDGWQTAPNPNTMRIATYRPSPDVEVSVSRAGGATDANIQRWVHQFEGAGAEKRTDTKAGGYDVHLVEVTGTYLSGGMMTGTPPEPHPGWSLVGAVVEAPGSHYFFKMVGPAGAVRAAQPSFEAMVRGVRPR